MAGPVRATLFKAPYSTAKIQTLQQVWRLNVLCKCVKLSSDHGGIAYDSSQAVDIEMAIPHLAAAKIICECNDWRTTNLTLQKILYIANVVHLGLYCGPLVDVEFEAWEYGPVAPDLYHQFKGYGSKPIPEIKFWSVGNYEGTLEYDTLIAACENLRGKTGSELISNTHWSGGAWSKLYVPRANVTITRQDMLDEYQNRVERSQAA